MSERHEKSLLEGALRASWEMKSIQHFFRKASISLTLAGGAGSPQSSAKAQSFIWVCFTLHCGFWRDLIYCSLFWTESQDSTIWRDTEPDSQCTDGRGMGGTLWMEEKLSASHLFLCEKMPCSWALEQKDKEHGGRESSTPQIPRQ